MRYSVRLLAMSVALAVAACHHATAPAPVTHAPPPPPPPPPPKPAPVIRAPVAAKWNFTSATCDATAASGALSLDISVAQHELLLTARPGKARRLKPGLAASIEFAGASSTWSFPAHVNARRRVTSVTPLTEDSAGRVLVLLEGGMVRIGPPSLLLPRLHVPNGGAAGRAWFACVRHQL